jgi:HD superfamily phosphohydrolase YqeK
VSRGPDAGELEALKTWFWNYSDSFSLPDAKDQRNIVTKQEHTREVCLNAVRIARDLGLDERGIALAELTALFHDVGRFPQYKRYRTFDDGISVNHAALGATVLTENGVLGVLSKPDRELILHAVTLHNVFSLPEGLDSDTLRIARIVRDADKLDILRVVLDYLGRDAESRAEAVALGLPDRPGYSRDVLASVLRGEPAKKSDLRTLNDFKLLQLSWLYDFNFACSLRMVLERKYIEQIARELPEDDEITKAVETVRGCARRRILNGRVPARAP